MALGVTSELTGWTSKLDLSSSEPIAELPSVRRRDSVLLGGDGNIFCDSKAAHSRMSVSLAVELDRLEPGAMTTATSLVDRKACGVTGLGRPDNWLVLDGDMLKPNEFNVGEFGKALSLLYKVSIGAGDDSVVGGCSGRD